ncbi:hypothetical protein [Aquisphaera insulae]|nr:hypothetical protein [Aquisphaera insulae]
MTVLSVPQPGRALEVVLFALLDAADASGISSFLDPAPWGRRRIAG